MTRSKMLERLRELLGEEHPEKKKKRLRKLLKALKEKQKELEKRLEHCDGPHQRRRLEQKIAVIREQRKKGQAICRGREESAD